MQQLEELLALMTSALLETLQRHTVLKELAAQTLILLFVMC
jgi:hypothetical protein